MQFDYDPPDAEQSSYVISIDSETIVPIFHVPVFIRPRGGTQIQRAVDLIEHLGMCIYIPTDETGGIGNPYIGTTKKEVSILLLLIVYLDYPSAKACWRTGFEAFKQ
jgi:hypothetical protein